MICYNEIWRFQISFNEVDFIDIKLSNYPKLKYINEQNQVFYRMHSGEWKINRTLEPSVFDILKLKIQDPNAVVDNIMVKANLYDTSGVFIETKFTGYVPVSGCEIHEDHGWVVFTPEPKDEYQFWDENKDKKYDINNYDIYKLNSYEITYGADSQTWKIFEKDTGGPPIGASRYTACDFVPDDWQSGRSYTTTNGQAPTDAYTKGWVMYGGDSYRCKLAHTSSPANKPVFGGNTWWEDVGYFSYGQQQADIPLTGYSAGNSIFDTGFPNITALVPDATNCVIGKSYKAQCTVTSTTGTLTNYGKRLVDLSGGSDGILNKLFLMYGITLNIVSDFFSDATNPISGTTNKLTNVCIAQNRNIINQTEVPLTGEMSLQDITNVFRDVFNCYWYVDGNDFIVEHYDFFDKGKAYGGTPTVGIDLTNEVLYLTKYQILKDLNEQYEATKYDFASDEFYEKEIWRWSTKRGYDGLIEYTSLMVKKGSDKTYNLAPFMTDVEYILEHPDQVDESGYMIVACDGSYVIYNRDAYKFGYTPGMTSMSYFYDVVNGDLCWDSLLNDWFLYGRYLESLKIDGIAKTAETTRRIKKQVVKFPRLENFDPFELVKTNIGNAKIKEVEINTDTDFCTAQLLYEA